jgi:hypothetical protein
VTLRRSLIAAALALVVLLPTAAPAYPPITCGRTTVGGKTYIVRSHGPKCADAIRWSRRFIARHKAPKGFTCRAYGAAVPASCVRKGKKNTYFSATK